MNATLFLRIAAVITFLYCLGHSAGMPWTPATGPAELPVIEGMKNQVFAAEGVNRTYWDFYFGFGVIISAFLLVQAIVLWQLGGIAKLNPATVRPVVITFLLGFIVNTGLAWKYFFAVPAVMAAAIVACLTVAWVLAGRTSPA